MITPNSSKELKAILTNPKTTQYEIEQLIERDPNPNLNPFDSNLKVKSQSVNPSIDDQWFNTVAREYRQQRYQKKIKEGFNGIKIVSEGDSWFQFPFLLKDVIDWLSDDYAIWSLDAAGDTLEHMASDLNLNKIIEAIRVKNPDVFLISGGGNDMFADGIFSTLINSSTGSLDPNKYLNANFDRFIKKIIDLYRKLFKEILKESPRIKIICHGYDYVIPRESGIFMGDNMKNKKITNARLQKEIMEIVINQFNKAQIELVQSEFRDRIFHVDCRTAVNT